MDSDIRGRPLTESIPDEFREIYEAHHGPLSEPPPYPSGPSEEWKARFDMRMALRDEFRALFEERDKLCNQFVQDWYDRVQKYREDHRTQWIPKYLALFDRIEAEHGLQERQDFEQSQLFVHYKDPPTATFGDKGEYTFAWQLRTEFKGPRPIPLVRAHEITTAERLLHAVELLHTEREWAHRPDQPNPLLDPEYIKSQIEKNCSSRPPPPPSAFIRRMMEGRDKPRKKKKTSAAESSENIDKEEHLPSSKSQPLPADMSDYPSAGNMRLRKRPAQDAPTSSTTSTKRQKIGASSAPASGTDHVPGDKPLPSATTSAALPTQLSSAFCASHNIAPSPVFSQQAGDINAKIPVANPSSTSPFAAPTSHTYTKPTTAGKQPVRATEIMGDNPATTFDIQTRPGVSNGSLYAGTAVGPSQSTLPREPGAEDQVQALESNSKTPTVYPSTNSHGVISLTKEPRSNRSSPSVPTLGASGNQNGGESPNSNSVGNAHAAAHGALEASGTPIPDSPAAAPIQKPHKRAARAGRRTKPHTALAPASSSSGVVKNRYIRSRDQIKLKTATNGKYWIFRHNHATRGDHHYVLRCPRRSCLSSHFKRDPLERSRAVEHFTNCRVPFEDEEDLIDKYALIVEPPTPGQPLCDDWVARSNSRLLKMNE